MSDIPPEIIDDILCPLPVKSLLRFRCVCKSWKSFINSSNFINAHLKRQQVLKPNSDFKLIFHGDSLYSIDFSSINSPQPQPQPQQLDHPLKHPNRPTQIVASCNGLLFLRNNPRNNPNDVGLFNPSTNMFLRLPICPFVFPRNIAVIQCCLGFGYDASTDDYKVVDTKQWLNRSGDGIIRSWTMIYSLKLGSWKKAQEGCRYWLENIRPVSAGGVLHWLQANTPPTPLNLVGFNLATDKFQEVPCPEIFGERFLLISGVLGDCLCLFASHFSAYADVNDYVLRSVDIWVMKDYGVKESWMKLFSVAQPNGGQCFSYLKPITYSVTGKEVLLEMDCKLWWYNLEKKSLEPVKFSGEVRNFDSHVCLGTLVPLYKGGNGWVRKKKIEPKSGGKNIRKGDDFLKKCFKL